MLLWTMPNGQKRQVEEGSTLLTFAKSFSDQYGSPIVEGLFNNKAVDLQRPIYDDGTVDFIEVNDEQGMRVYTRTLLFMALTAARRLYPQAALEVRNTLGSALYLADIGKHKLSEQAIKNIEAEMKRMAAEHTPIALRRLPKYEAISLAGPCCSEERMALLQAVPDDKLLTVYYLEGQTGYLFGSLCPDCGYVPYFELLPYDEGMIINYPDIGHWNELKPFVNMPKLNEVFQESEHWAAMIECNTIGKLNKIIDMGYADGIIRVAEALHEKKFAQVADYISQHRDKVKLILIAGPSSSGKTSTAQRLSVQLAVNGLRPMAISMDDYYHNRKDTPRKPDGSYDFESIEAVDLELFNSQLMSLLKGERVKVPKFNFRTGCREYRGKELQMAENSILVVEGIHGLNERLTASIPEENKIKIFVSALTPMSLDEHNRIHTTDVRLMRRLVRDSQFRSHGAVETLELWDDVRYGEEQYIFPFQCSANVIFNTTLIYELAVLKKYAQPMLEDVQPSDGRAYTIAQRLLELLWFVKPIDENAIPNNSILREFIGGSIFKEAL